MMPPLRGEYLEASKYGDRSGHRTVSHRETIAMSLLNPLLLRTRRHFFRDCAVGVGSMALASLLHAGTQPTSGLLQKKARCMIMRR
jgi:hypothetical protein